MGLFGNQNNAQLKKLKKIADKVIALEDKYKEYSNEQLRACTDEFKSRLSVGETLNDILPEAFAVVREASARVLNMRHFYVQIMGGIALHQGRIAEMATGEGKTSCLFKCTHWQRGSYCYSKRVFSKAWCWVDG